MRRAKEYLEAKKDEMPFFDIVERCIMDLYPLRHDKCKTQEYFNRYLFADARNLSDKKKLNGDLSAEGFILNEDEVNVNDAGYVRHQILNAILDDKTFIYAYTIITEGNCMYNDCLKISFATPWEINKNTKFEIKKLIAKLKEDYPKTHLTDFLVDDANASFYYEKKAQVNKNEEWWINAFNKAYELFDVMRVKVNNPFETMKLFNQLEDCDITFNSFKYVVGEIISYLLNNYDYGTDEEDIIKLSEIENFKKKMNIFKVMIDEDLSVISQGAMLEEPLDLINREYSTNEIIEFDAELDSDNVGFSASEYAIFFNYFLVYVGKTYKDLPKTKYAKVISKITGKSMSNIKKHLAVDCSNPLTISKMIRIENLIKEGMPFISNVMKTDRNSVDL